MEGQWQRNDKGFACGFCYVTMLLILVTICSSVEQRSMQQNQETSEQLHEIVSFPKKHQEFRRFSWSTEPFTDDTALFSCTRSNRVILRGILAIPFQTRFT